MSNRAVKTILLALLGKFSSWPVLVLVLVLLAGLTYIRGLDNLLVGEDFDLPALSHLTFAEMWQIKIVGQARIRPVFWSAGWILAYLFGPNPVGYHFVVLILHTGVSVLMFFVGSLLSGDRRIGFVSALVYTAYPRHHEPVLWPAAIQFVIVNLFSLFCLYAFGNYLRTKRVVWQLLTLASLCFALVSNEAAVILFLLLPLLDLILHRTDTGIRVLFSSRFYIKYVPHMILLVFYIWLNFGGARLLKLSSSLAEKQLLQGLYGETYHLTGLGIGQIKDAFSYLTYLMYPQIPLRSLDPNVWTAMLALATGLLLLFMLVRGSPVIRFSILWLGLAILPFVLFVPFGNADRYFYLPAAGLSLLAGALTVTAHDRFVPYRPILVRLVLGGLLASYLVSSIVLIQLRIAEWRRAGEITSEVVSQTMRLYPDPARGSTFLYVDLPGRYGQAMVFLGGGIKTALSVAYGKRLPFGVFQTRDPEVKAFLEKATPVDEPVPDLHVFLYQDGVLVEKSDSVETLESLRPATWYDH